MGRSELHEWLESAEYLPECIRDFHDQKDLFKSIHHLYQDNPGADQKPDWVSAHIYTIDWFLWFMASRGYTLQKSRKQLEFQEWPNYREIMLSELMNAETK